MFKKKNNDDIYAIITNLYKDTDVSLTEFENKFNTELVSYVISKKIANWLHNLCSSKKNVYNVNIFISK